MELLIVVVIIVLISAVSIPVMLPALESRRMREAARAVNVFIGAARTRAMATGRPVGVMIHRQENRPEAALTLSYVKVPPDWQGDTLDSRVVIEEGVDPNTGLPNVQFLGWVGANGDVFRGLEYRDGFFRPGDRFQLGGQGHWYNIRGRDEKDQSGGNNPDGLPDHDVEGYIDYGPPWDVVRDDLLPFRTDIPAQDAKQWAIAETIRTLPPRARRPVTPSPTAVIGLTFRLRRQLAPVSSAAAGMQLPDTMVIDLTASSSGGEYFTPDATDPLYAETIRAPVVIMFAANGAVDQYYLGGESIRPRGDIFLLVGRTQRVQPIDQQFNPLDEDELPNWADLSNLWVAINTQTGRVSTSANAAVDATLLSDVSDQGMVVERRQAIHDHARSFTRAGQDLGGR